MSPLISEDTVRILLVVWFILSVVVGIAVTAFFRTRPNVNLSRAVHRVLTIVFGTAFLLIVLAREGLSRPILLWATIGILIIWLNLRYTYFCEACGKPYNWLTMTRGNSCSRCGHDYS